MLQPSLHFSTMPGLWNGDVRGDPACLVGFILADSFSPTALFLLPLVAQRQLPSVEFELLLKRVTPGAHVDTRRPTIHRHS